MSSPRRVRNASAWVTAGEKVLDSIAKPAMATRGRSLSAFLLLLQLIKAVAATSSSVKLTNDFLITNLFFYI